MKFFAYFVMGAVVSVQGQNGKKNKASAPEVVAGAEESTGSLTSIPLSLDIVSALGAPSPLVTDVPTSTILSSEVPAEAKKGRKDKSTDANTVPAAAAPAVPIALPSDEAVVHIPAEATKSRKNKSGDAVSAIQSSVPSDEVNQLKIAPVLFIPTSTGEAAPISTMTEEAEDTVDPTPLSLPDLPVAPIPSASPVSVPEAAEAAAPSPKLVNPSLPVFVNFEPIVSSAPTPSQQAIIPEPNEPVPAPESSSEPAPIFVAPIIPSPSVVVYAPATSSICPSAVPTSKAIDPVMPTTSAAPLPVVTTSSCVTESSTKAPLQPSPSPIVTPAPHEAPVVGYSKQIVAPADRHVTPGTEPLEASAPGVAVLANKIEPVDTESMSKNIMSRGDKMTASSLMIALVVLLL